MFIREIQPIFTMKFIKFFLGILLFIAPITLHITPDDNMSMMTPLGYVYHFDNIGETYYELHDFRWYSGEGRYDYFIQATDPLEFGMNRCSQYMLILDFPVANLTLEGILTILTLWGIAAYLIMTIIDIKILNIISDIFMIGLAIVALFAFLNYSQVFVLYKVGIPIFTIAAGLLGVTGLVLSSLALKRK
ncbi:MAG: hypothetical protein ACTSQF_12240 [Candidatus Heimdallarchaeaceae archaeon]